MFKINLSKDFWYYEIGQFISYMGDFCSTIALSWWILDTTGSIGQVAAILAPASVFKIVLIPIFAPFSDHFPRKILLIISDFGRFLITVCIAFCIYYHYYNFPIFLLLYSLLNIFSALYITTSSIVSQLIPADKLEKGLRISQSMTSLGGITGGAVAGFVVAYFGVFIAFLVDACSFFIAGIFSVLIRSNTRPIGSQVNIGFDFKKWKNDFNIGLKIIFTSKILYGMAFIALAINFFVASIWILFPLLIKNICHKNADFFGFMESGYAIGTLIAAGILGILAKSIKGFYLYFIAFFLVGILLAFMPFIPFENGPILLMLLIGFLITLANIPYSTKMNLAVPDQYRARVNAITTFMAAGITPFGIAAAGFFAQYVAVQYLILIYGVCISVTVLFLFLIPGIISFMNVSHEEAHLLLKDQFSNQN